jgi:8-oxo-(d)GTP phosphatase
VVAVIRAAGGVVWRRGPEGQAEVCLVHRERYDDWTLPKGKLRQGEHPLAAAVREVEEETGVRAVPQLRLPSTRYRVDGVAKVVDFWAMWALEVPRFHPNSEVDDLAWLPAGQAASRLGYAGDLGVLRRWSQAPEVSTVMLVVRHAYAGNRGSWPGPDRHRPLDTAGEADAAALCRLLALFHPEALVSASPRRCVQTLAPLAEAMDQPVEVATVFDESAADPEAAVLQLWRLACSGRRTVICTQGGVIGPLLSRLTGDADVHRWRTAKGDGWLVPFSGPLPLAPSRLAVGPPVRR